VRIAFFILMHCRPEQAVRLIERLDSPSSMFVVHVDRRAAPGVNRYIRGWGAERSRVHLARRYVTRHSGFGLVAATLECMRTALQSGEAFDYAILLSGQDYPIKPLQYIREFPSMRRKQFIESFRLDENNRWSTHAGAEQAMNRISWYCLPIRGRRLHIPMRRRVPLGLHPYGGSQWWCLSRDCIAYIDGFVSKNPQVLRFFRHVYIPDECFFQTIVSNSHFGSEVVDYLHYIDWTRPNPHYPRTLDATDFERIQLSTKLFARKFDTARDQRILDLIDREILVARTVGQYSVAGHG
jgi:Core-2/I-Branching enzyme